MPKTTDKPGTIRKGQKHPYKKATNAQLSERIEWIALHLLCNPAATEGELKAIIKQRYNIQWNMALIYITRAKELIKKRSEMTRADAKQISVNALLDTIQHGNNSERNSAIRLIADIYGFEAPKQHRIGDPTGKPLAPAIVAPTVQFVIPSNGRGDRKSAPERNGH